MRRACHKPRDRGARGRQGEEGVGGVPRVLLREVYAGGGKGRTGTERQRARDPGAWEGEQGRTREGEQTGGRTGPGSRGRERGQRGSAASRIAPHRARAGRRAEEQRWQGSEEGVPRRHERANVGQKQKGAPQPSEPPAVRGGTRRGGAPRRAATRQSTPTGAVSYVASCNEGQVRACDMRATCLHSVLRSVLRWVESEKGRGGRGRQGGRRGTKAAGGCSATCVPQAQGLGRQGAAR